MKNKSIAFKLFIITSLFFLVFLVTAMAVQTMFFEKFYINQKIDRLYKNVESFAEVYKAGGSDLSRISKNTNKFIDENNAQVAILDANGVAKYLNSYEITVVTDDDRDIRIPLNNIVSIDEFQKLKLQVGSFIAVEGVSLNNNNNVIVPFSIESEGNRWQSFTESMTSVKIVKVIGSPTASQGILIDDPKDITLQKDVIQKKGIVQFNLKSPEALENVYSQKMNGKIIELNLPTKLDAMMPVKKDMLMSAIDNWFWISKANNFNINSDRIISFNYTSPSNGVENIVFIKPILENNSLKEMIFVMSSLQPVGEAVNVMKDFYMYAFLGALCLIIFLSLIYSRMIVKPLIKINNAALRMSNLDFTVECEESSSDEIGSLAKSLNSLSKNLRTSLDDLKSANEQLKTDIERERKLEDIRKEFVSSVSHELKTPLGIMKGFTEGLRDGVAEEKKDYYLSVILDEISKMDGLVLDMLDLSKLESKAYKLKHENFCVDELIHDVEYRFLNHIKEKNIIVNHYYDNEEYLTYGDRSRIEQVVVNLFSNAVRHTEKNGVINISITREDEKILVSIENSGNHIPEDKLDRIWDRFYRVEESRDRQSGGTGLGLSIVRNILELHKSRYGVKNTDSGVIFYFTLDTKI